MFSLMDDTPDFQKKEADPGIFRLNWQFSNHVFKLKIAKSRPSKNNPG